jgi:hypothetical protein
MPRTRTLPNRRRLVRSIAAGVAALVLAGGAYGVVSASSHSASGSATPATQASSGAPNARSGPAAGGTSGTVVAVSASGFTLKTPAGQQVTVKATSTTAYKIGTASGSPNAVSPGAPVTVLGTTSSTTITASQVIVRPTSSRPPPSWAGQVIPFQRGAQSASKRAGQIPASYSQGSGSIVGGAAADEATTAALAAYPGGIVDRVVRLSNGEYEVHYIGVNWPHHIFINQDFRVVGAD